jgi:hypothetical protein
MRKKNRKLTLSTETLRTLEAPSLKEVVGGGTVIDSACTIACSACSAACTACTAKCTACAC